MIFGVLKEYTPENRVALTPESVEILARRAQVMVERGAGLHSFFSDSSYEKAGALLADRMDLFERADCILSINSLPPAELEVWKAGKVLAGGLDPYHARESIDVLLAKSITSFSLELLPRTTLAQSMDVLSSMATVAGYRAVLEAAIRLPKFFPMFMTAAGTIKPAKLLVLGAGVAGLQALATARRLGAVVEVFDVRSAVKEEVQSLGGKFIEVAGAMEDKSAGGYAIEQTEEFRQKQRDLIHQHALRADIIISTAQIPGKKAPVLLFRETIEAMQAGSVIIDLASATGGNIELTRDGEEIHHHGVTIIGRSDYPSAMPLDASRMYGNNLLNFTRLLIGEDGGFQPDWNDEIISKSCLTHQGKIMHEKILQYYSS